MLVGAQKEAAASARTSLPLLKAAVYYTPPSLRCFYLYLSLSLSISLVMLIYRRANTNRRESIVFIIPYAHIDKTPVDLIPLRRQLTLPRQCQKNNKAPSFWDRIEAEAMDRSPPPSQL